MLNHLFQTVYDEWFITLYNLVYTALPVLGMSLFDQVCNSFVCNVFVYLGTMNPLLFVQSVCACTLP